MISRNTDTVALIKMSTDYSSTGSGIAAIKDKRMWWRRFSSSWDFYI